MPKISFVRIEIFGVARTLLAHRMRTQPAIEIVVTLITPGCMRAFEFADDTGKPFRIDVLTREQGKAETIGIAFEIARMM